MLMECVVGVVALITASALHPGDYFAINTPPDVFSKLGIPTVNLVDLENQVGEIVTGRTGGGVSLAVGMAQIFSALPGMRGLMAYWYHFAIMFEAVFILTTIDAGTPVGQFMLQELLGHISEPIGRTSWYPSILFSSFLVVIAWGYFLYQGVVDPLGGINSLWPLFGIANQLLAAVALCVATTVLAKMGKLRYSWVPLLPLAWLASATLTAGWQKVFSPDPKLGFLSHAQSLAGSTNPAAAQMIFNDRIDAALALFFMIIVVVVILASAREWYLIAAGRKTPKVNEAPFVESRLDAARA